MAAYFAGTLTALKKGITKMTISAAVRNIENWEESLQDVELTGCRAILRDLAALKKQLQEDEPDGDRIRHLMAKLASQTVSIADRADARYSDKIKNLGEMLADAAESAESEDDSPAQSESKQMSTKAKTSGDDDHDDDGRFAKGNHASQSRSTSNESRSMSGSARSKDSGNSSMDGASPDRRSNTESDRGRSDSRRS
jgi:hypothetical protein